MQAIIALLAVLIGFGTPAANAAAEFNLVLIAPPPGGTSSGANDINASGTVVGWYNLSSSGHGAFRWTPTTSAGDTGSIVALSPLHGCNMTCDAEAYRVNARGDAVGYSNSAAGEPRAVLWTVAGTTPVDLGLLPGYTRAWAHDINDDGEIVGKTEGPTVPTQAFRWTPTVPNGTSGTLTALPGLPDAIRSSARAINNAGVVAGWNQVPDSRAVRWDASVPGDLHLGLAWDHSNATAVNTIGRVFGDFSTASIESAKQAFGFRGPTTGSGVVLLGTLPGRTSSDARDINGPGLVVGGSFNGGGDKSLAYLWSSLNGMRNLNGLTPPTSQELRIAKGINDDRRIVGESHSTATGSRAFLLLPAAQFSPTQPWGFPQDVTGAVAIEDRPYIEVCDPLHACRIVRVTNVSARAMGGPLQLVLTQLGRGWQLVGAAGTYREAPFVSAEVRSLEPGASVDVLLSLRLDHAANAGPLSYAIKVYAGRF